MFLLTQTERECRNAEEGSAPLDAGHLCLLTKSRVQNVLTRDPRHLTRTDTVRTAPGLLGAYQMQAWTRPAKVFVTPEQYSVLLHSGVTGVIRGIKIDTISTLCPCLSDPLGGSSVSTLAVSVRELRSRGSGPTLSGALCWNYRWGLIFVPRPPNPGPDTGALYPPPPPSSTQQVR